MSFPARILTERFSAYLALEHFLSGVYQHVLLQYVDSAEGFAARLTPVAAFAAVRDQVTFQLTDVTERFVAHLALVRQISGVGV